MYRVLLIVGVAFLIASCYPGGAEYVSDIDVVYTTYEQDYNFKGQSTYAMPDKIVVDVKIKDGDTTYIYMKQGSADQILSEIEVKMQAYGWTKVDPIVTNPDIALTPSAIKSTTYFYSYWYDWWYGGWYPGWGWYYPPYYTISSYTTGSLIITMADPSVAEDNPIDLSPTVWIAVGNGLYTGNYNASRVTKAIDQAFSQSPYLKIN